MKSNRLSGAYIIIERIAQFRGGVRCRQTDDSPRGAFIVVAVQRGNRYVSEFIELPRQEGDVINGLEGDNILRELKFRGREIRPTD